jgi:hypothetical protein
LRKGKHATFAPHCRDTKGSLRQSRQRTERMPMEFLLLFSAFVVLGFVVEFVTFYRDVVRTPISAAANQRWWPQSDRRVLFRLAVIGGAAALTVAAAIIAGYSFNPRQTAWLLARPLDGHPEWFLPLGVVFCLLALLSGIKPGQAVLLFCLTLPGLVILPLLLLGDAMESKDVAGKLLAHASIFFLQPGALILLFIAIGQSRQLRKPGGDFTSGGFVRLVLIAFAYTYGLL